MAVYERAYRAYVGPTTEAWSRFLVIVRYAFQDAFASKLFVGFFVACFAWPLACAVVIYLHYNIDALAILEISALDIIQIDTTFFRLGVVRPQSVMAFLLILIVGPALVSPDLRNNALPLYLSRPLNKTDYVLGKFIVLASLASAVTWVPTLLLFFLQGFLAGEGWLFDNARIGFATLFSFIVWITVLSVFALAISAWVKWKPWARILFLGILFTFSALGQIFKLIYGTWWGSFLVLNDIMFRVWDQLFGIASNVEMPAAAAWFSLAAFFVFSLFMLYRRIRAFEVIS